MLSILAGDGLVPTPDDHVEYGSRLRQPWVLSLPMRPSFHKAANPARRDVLKLERAVYIERCSPKSADKTRSDNLLSGALPYGFARLFLD